MKANLSDFMFRGLLTKHALHDMQAIGQLREPIGSAQERQDIDIMAPVSD